MAQTIAANQAAATQARGAKVLQAALAAVLGLGLFIGVAFSDPAAIHNAAHDARHAMALPCH